MTPLGRFLPDGDAFVARLDAPECALLVHLVDEVVSLLGGAAAADVAPFTLSGEPVPAPEDPAVRRLLPDASRADPEMAAEFRRLTEADLRGVKVTQLLVLRAALAGDAPEVLVPAADAPAAAAALTDVRLVVADRLGLRTDADALQQAIEAELAAVDDAMDGTTGDVPEVPAHLVLAMVYDLLGLLQGTLVDCLLDGLDDGPAPEAAPRPR